ncbi:hypothetical protein AB4099_19125 [Bosea sp. 2KB_26]|uniref:hypothetical protein n=1 Tax=Bosea sp. 2KB_26 TaxID=3237475 RepID=UPI003F907639
MKPRLDVTLGNILSMGMTAVSLIAVIVTVSLSYAQLRAKDDVHDMRIAIVEAQIAKREVAEQSANNRLSTIEGDIRVIRQILEGVRQPPR